MRIVTFLSLVFVILEEPGHDVAWQPGRGVEARCGAQWGWDPFELAFRMQAAIPEVQSLADESPSTLRAYGLDDPVTANFGRQCLLARRFAERGVRFVQVTHSDSYVQWDQHSKLKEGHTKNAREVDKPIAALLSFQTRKLLVILEWVAGQGFERAGLWWRERGRVRR